ncbi:MAG: VanZ family protein [Lishizhenia sp.]
MFRYILPGIIWLTIILFLSLTPGNELQQVNWDYFAFDKFAHLSVYAILVHIWLTGLKRQRTSILLRNRAYLVVIISAFCLGVGIEIVQWTLITGRMFDGWDILANSTGIFLGVSTSYLLYRNYY